MRRLLAVACGTLALTSCQPPAGPPTDKRAARPVAPPQSSKLPDPAPDDRRGYPGGKIPVPTTAEELCCRFEDGDEFDFKLEVGEGERLFPLYREVLQDAARNRRCVIGVFSVLWRVAQDERLRPEVREQFIELTLSHIQNKAPSVQTSALCLLEVIGGERDTGPVAVALLNEDIGVRHAAAKTLAAIGGPRDVLVLDIVITNADRYHDAKGQRLLPAEYDVKHFEKCKAELEARLKKQEKPEPKK